VALPLQPQHLFKHVMLLARINCCNAKEGNTSGRGVGTMRRTGGAKCMITPGEAIKSPRPMIGAGVGGWG
jgi:hypothetical protein